MRIFPASTINVSVPGFIQTRERVIDVVSRSVAQADGPR